MPTQQQPQQNNQLANADTPQGDFVVDENVAIEREPLRWLFVATFNDGTTIEQPTDEADDVSQTRGDGTGNRFTDVLARQDELATFELLHTNGKEGVLVDLKNGAFVINGTPFHAHDQFFDPSKHQLRLVYFREARVDNDIVATVRTDGGVDRRVVGQHHYTNRYFVGWQTTVAGKNKQVTVAVG